ncbi:MAG: histidine phosphatase family protein [Rhodospirillales bacterium]|nr:MAG: histidine phosphatase family protein [Rhodospirillales bacterium]
MRDLLLMRHAKAGLGATAGGDRERPLNPRGRRAATAVGRELARLGARPDTILCSPARRTRETLDLVTPALKTAAPPAFEPALYLAEADELLARLRGLGDDTACALLVGHNDGIGALAARLATIGDERAIASLRGKFPTGAVAWLRLPLDDWGALGRTRGELFAFVRPRDLETR